MHFKFRNVNEAFRGLVEYFYSERHLVVETNSRNGPVLMIPEPVIVTYLEPRERVLFNQARDANPFFHLYESLWMLAGRNDVDPLKFFNSRIDQYSDDGKTLNGAYGYRWRKAKAGDNYDPRDGSFEINRVDQLSVLIEHLRINPTSRRAVLQMWDVEDDLLKIDSSKDACCLSWDTKFRSPEGDTNIQTLARRFQSQKGYKFPVYAVDIETGNQKLTWMTNAWKVGHKQTYKLTLDDGSSLRLTGDHTVFRKRKLFDEKRCVGISVEECLVCDLSPGDRLLAALPKDSGCRIWPGKMSKKNRTQYRQFKRNLFNNTRGSNMVKEHREYISLVDDLLPDHSVDHINGNGLDNRLSNLRQLPNSVHYAMDKMGGNNPHVRMDAKAKKARAHKLKETWADMPPEVRKAKGTYKADRTPEQWELIADYESSKSNHKIVSIEKDAVTAVFDFTVPGRHNAVLDNGVVVHNCNLSVMFLIRGTNPNLSERQKKEGLSNEQVVDLWGRDSRCLDMTVTNRSNDLIWGMLGANVCHFSFLQEYMAARLGVEVGVYHQISNNLHVYKNNWEPEKWLEDGTPDLYVGRRRWPNKTDLKKLGSGFDVDKDIQKLVEITYTNPGMLGSYSSADRFLYETANPMLMAFVAHKARDYSKAYEHLGHVEAPDWKFAGFDWIRKREQTWLERSHL